MLISGVLATSSPDRRVPNNVSLGLSQHCFSAVIYCCIRLTFVGLILSGWHQLHKFQKGHCSEVVGHFCEPQKATCAPESGRLVTSMGHGDKQTLDRSWVEEAQSLWEKAFYAASLYAG